MKKYLLFIYSVFQLNFYGQQWQWAKSFDLNFGNINPGSNCLAIDQDHNNYISVNVGSQKVCLLATNSSGHELWRKYLNGSLSISQIAVSADGIFAIGSFQGTLVLSSHTITSSGMYDIFFARFDMAGNIQWVKQAGGPKDDQGNGITTDQNGFVYITGSFKDTIMFENQTLTCECPEKLFIAKYNAQGVMQFLKSGTCYGGSESNSYARGTKIIVDPSGNIYCAGDHSYFTMDTINVFGGGGMYDAHFLMKMNASGTALWATEILNYSVPALEGITLDKDDRIILTGHEHWTLGGGAVTEKVSKYGQILWSNNFGYCGYGAYARSLGIASDNNSTYCIGNMTPGYNACTYQDARMFIAKHDPAGYLMSFDTLRGSVHYTNIVKDDDSFIVCGMYSGSLSLGNSVLNANSNRELFLARFKAVSSAASTNELIKDKQETGVYPNPSNGKMSIKTVKNAKLNIYDHFGKCVISIDCKKNSENIDISKEKRGIYFVEIISEDDRTVKRIVVE